MSSISPKQRPARVRGSRSCSPARKERTRSRSRDRSPVPKSEKPNDKEAPKKPENLPTVADSTKTKEEAKTQSTENTERESEEHTAQVQQQAKETYERADLFFQTCRTKWLNEEPVKREKVQKDYKSKGIHDADYFAARTLVRTAVRSELIDEHVLCVLKILADKTLDHTGKCWCMAAVATAAADALPRPSSRSPQFVILLQPSPSPLN
jgi:hypothetical protein